MFCNNHLIVRLNKLISKQVMSFINLWVWWERTVPEKMLKPWDTCCLWLVLPGGEPRKAALNFCHTFTFVLRALSRYKKIQALLQRANVHAFQDMSHTHVCLTWTHKSATCVSACVNEAHQETHILPGRYPQKQSWRRHVYGQIKKFLFLCKYSVFLVFQ